jgi:hypothetical protein
MAKQSTRTLSVRHTDLDPNTHRTREVFQQIGLVEVTITVTQTGRGEPTVDWTGRRVIHRDGAPSSAPFRPIRHGSDPDWVQKLIDEALAEFDTLTRSSAL